MNTHFHNSPKLPNEKLKELTQGSDRPAATRFLVTMSVFLLSCLWVVYSWDKDGWQIVLSQLVFALAVCSQFAGLHETGHGTAFRSRGKNQVAAFLFGITHVYPSSLFRSLHFTHHRFTHIPGKDPEISLGHRPMPSVISQPPMYLAWLTGMPLLLFKVLMILVCALGLPEFLRKNLYPFIAPRKRWKICLESWVVMGVYALIIFLAIQVNAGFWAIILGQFVGHGLLASYTATEHNGLPHEGSIFERTRSIQANKFVKFVFWNMPYHAEHHAYPAVPFYALPKLHDAIKEEIAHQDKNHAQFHAWVLRRFWKRKS